MGKLTSQHGTQKTVEFERKTLCPVICPQFSFGLQSEVLKMSAAVVEAAPAPPNPANPVIEEIQENRDKLGDLVDKMDNVKINENGVADPEKIIKHPRNQPGGRWMINVDKRQRAECLDTYWLEILFFLIGEHADQHAHQVNGAVVNVRAKGDKLAVWLADASQPDGILRIGKMIKERLGIDPDQTIGFNIHNEEKAAARNAKTKKFFV